MGSNKKLKLITGSGAAQRIEVNKVSVDIVPDSLSPLPVDIKVFEEDTCLVLTVDPVMQYVEEHPIRLMTRIMETKPQQPGSVVANGSSWYAVVHNLDEDPIYRKEWIECAYKELFRLVEEKGVKVLGLPLLGTVHGTFPIEKSIRLMLRYLQGQPFLSLKKIVVLVRPNMIKDVREMLEKEMVDKG